MQRADIRSGTCVPGGELMFEVQTRGMSALLQIRTSTRGATIVIVTHADVIRAMIAHCLGAPLDLAHRTDVDAASVSTIELHEWGRRVRTINRCLFEQRPHVSTVP